MSNEQLLALIAEGDGQALRELYSRYARKVYAIVRHLLVDQNTCEEVAQDVFTRVWITRAFNPNEGLVGHWICVIARRVAQPEVHNDKKPTLAVVINPLSSPLFFLHVI